MVRAANFFVSALCFLLVWQGVYLLSSNILFPSPQSVTSSLYLLLSKGVIFPHIVSSLKRVIAGFVMALIVAMILGYSASLLPRFGNILSPIIDFLRPIPPIAWIPVSIAWFGIGDASASFIIFLAAFFPVFTSIYFSGSSVPVTYMRLAREYRLTPAQRFWHIIFPYSAPFMINGSKTGIGFSWMAVIAAEMVSANSGLGYFIELNRVLMNIDTVIATMLVIGFIGYILAFLFVIIEKRAVYWRVNDG